MSEIINLNDWLRKYEKDFLPPVCNKLMHNEQLSVMFVGGPNQRYDYHIQEDEELFYQIKGDMKLPIVYEGSHIDIHIKEGEIFRLPRRIPHSPQRNANTCGLVMERRRNDGELDVLRYYVNGHYKSEVLYQKTLKVTDLGKDLAPVIKGYFASEEYQTKVPDPSKNYTQELPFEMNPNAEIVMPYNLENWLAEHMEQIQENGRNGVGYDLFSPSDKETGKGLHVVIYGPGEYQGLQGDSQHGDHWVWMKNGGGAIQVENGEVENLVLGDTKLVKIGTKCTSFSVENLALVIYLPKRT